MAGPDGNLWFTEAGSNVVGRITPRGVISEYAIPSRDGVRSDPTNLTVGPDHALWITLTDANRIARLDPSNPPPTLTDALPAQA